MPQESNKQDIQRLFKSNPENTYLLYLHNGTSYLIKHPSLQGACKIKLPYKEGIDSAHNMLDKYTTDTKNINISEKDFFNHDDPHFKYVQYAKIDDNEFDWLIHRYPWDFVFAYIEPKEVVKKKRRSKQTNETEEIKENEDQSKPALINN